MFTLRRTTHIASLITTVATIYVFFYTHVDREITFALMLLFLLVAFNTAEIQSK
jgi:hypothetical protein